MFRCLRSVGFLDHPFELMGSALEGLVEQHLVAFKDYQEDVYTLSYWRIRAGNEVDFVLYGEKFFLAIEVKAGETLQTKETSGLNAFCEDYPEATLVLLYRGSEKLKRGRVWYIPVDIFLKALTPDIKNLLAFFSMQDA